MTTLELDHLQLGVDNAGPSRRLNSTTFYYLAVGWKLLVGIAYFLFFFHFFLDFKAATSKLFLPFPIFIKVRFVDPAMIFDLQRTVS